MKNKILVNIPETNNTASSNEAAAQYPILHKHPHIKAGLKKLKSKKAKRIIYIILILAVLAGAAYMVLSKNSTKKAAGSTLTEATVTTGDISNTISGSGEVEPAEEYTVVPTVTGTILTDHIQDGAQINKGDLLYSIDPTNAENSIKQDENSLEKAQLTYSQAEQTLGELRATSNISGVITKVYVKNGDQVQANAPIMDVENDSSLVLTLPFNASDTANMYNGESAQVTLDSTGTVLDGTVSSIYSGQEISGNGALVTNVDITFSNPGVVKSGETATAVVGGQFACNSSGTVVFAESKTITAKTSGQINGLTLRAGDAVNSGENVANLTNDSDEEVVKNDALQVQSTQLSLQNAKNVLNNYNITSPISGTVIEKDSKAGDTIGNSTSSTKMAVIADMSSLVLTINVDELDILNVKVGQTATITADALPKQAFTGQVTSVSSIGSGSSSSSSTSSSSSSGTGVTTYAVQITISDYGELLPGMNVNAVIIIKSAQNVLLIPEQAVVNGSYVLKKINTTSDTSSSASTSASGKNYNNRAKASPEVSAATPSPNASPSASQSSSSNSKMKALQAKAPAGYEYVKIELGITNTSYAEVTSGLNAGDVIAYTTAVASSASSTGTTARSSSSLLGIGGGSGNGSGSSAYRTSGAPGSVTGSGAGSASSSTYSAKGQG